MNDAASTAVARAVSDAARGDRRRSRNRFRLVAGAVLVTVAVVGLAAMAVRQTRQDAEMRLAADTQSLARLMQQTYDGLIDTVDVGLLVAVDEFQRQWDSGAIDPPSMNRFLRRLEQRIPMAAHISATDAEGRIVYGNHVTSPPTVISDREHFLYARDHPQAGLYVHKPKIARSTQQWNWAFSRRLTKPDGSFGGMVALAFPVEALDRKLSEITLNHPGDTLALRDGELRLIARHVFQGENHTPYGDQNVAPLFAQALRVDAAQGTYIGDAPGIDAVRHMHAYRRSEKYGYYVNVGIASDASLRAWRRQAGTVAALVGLFVIVTTVLTRQMLRAWDRQEQDLAMMTNSRELLREAQRIANLGQFQYEPATGRWSTSEIFDRICGVPDGGVRDFREWLCLVEADHRGGVAAGIDGAIQGRASFDQAFRLTRPKDGSERWIHGIGKLSRGAVDGAPVLIGTIQDITDRKRAEEEIRSLAFYDPLTRLPNRRLLMDRLSQALAASARNQEYGALLMLDLDHFKKLNDSRGHDVGDRLLVDVAKRLAASIRQEDTVSRLGGDEFVVIVEGLGAQAQAAATQAECIAEKLRDALNQPYALSGAEADFAGTPSIGLTLFRGMETSMQALMKQADVALYQAKGAGRNMVRFFDPEMQAAIDANVALEAAIRRGLAKGEFRLYYQPQVDAEGRRIGAEALLRWMHPERGLVLPGAFVPLAEDTGLIDELGQWVLDAACAQLRRWADDPRSAGLQLCVNVSAHQFHRADFVGRVQDGLARHGANPERLKLELTESAILENADQMFFRMHQLIAMGVQFVLDDFGTGYSSLSYLKRLPLHQVKIDRSFVRDVAHDANDAAIVQAILSMCGSLRLQVIAEGVETAAQHAFLARHGCQGYQGFLFGAPMPIAAWDAMF